MKALITGGSSGIGKSIAKELHKRGYEIILVARNQKKLEEVKKEIGNNVQIISTDISNVENCKKLHQDVKKENIDILINSAGFGMHGKFLDDDLDQQMNMIDLNIKATQTLTKLFLEDFKKRDSGYILNIASTAAFSPGPLMASYFASKAYILRLTTAIAEEIKKEHSHVYIGCLCPGPVDTSFNDKLGVKFSKAQNSDELAQYAIKKMFQKKWVIIPTMNHKLNAFFNKFVPLKILLNANYNVQIKKIENAKKNK
jgi:short-subunit dehydrogenase